MKNLSTKMAVLIVSSLFALTQVQASTFSDYIGNQEEYLLNMVLEDEYDEVATIQNDNFSFAYSLEDDIYDEDFFQEEISESAFINADENVCEDYVAEDTLLANYMLGTTDDVLYKNEDESLAYDINDENVCEDYVAEDTLLTNYMLGKDDNVLCDNKEELFAYDTNDDNDFLAFEEESSLESDGFYNEDNTSIIAMSNVVPTAFAMDLDDEVQEYTKYEWGNEL